MQRSLVVTALDCRLFDSVRPCNYTSFPDGSLGCSAAAGLQHIVTEVSMSGWEVRCIERPPFQVSFIADSQLYDNTGNSHQDRWRFLKLSSTPKAPANHRYRRVPGKTRHRHSACHVSFPSAKRGCSVTL